MPKPLPRGFQEDEQSVQAANGGKRNDDARGYLALHGTSKLMGQNINGDSGRNRTAH